MGREVCACEWAWGKQTHTGVSMGKEVCVCEWASGETDSRRSEHGQGSVCSCKWHHGKQIHAGVIMGREVCTCEWPRGKLRFLSGNLPDGGGLNLSRLKSAS